MFKLVISDDEGKTTVVPLVRDEITIGRKEGNTIRLTERNVSRRHARLARANGSFVVEDLKSYNGVRINGRRIDQDGPIDLKSGDQIGIGDYLLALQQEEAAATLVDITPVPSGPPPRLVMVSPPAPGAEYALTRDRFRVGRAEDLPVWVNHRSVSREHVEMTREGDNFRVVDLSSANGVRVNGEPVTEAVIAPGDVLDLGQVRFRYVGEGEEYVFDADATIQMAALPDLEPPASRAPILTAAAILLIAVVVGAAIALSGDDDEPGSSPLGRDHVVQENPQEGSDTTRQDLRSTEERLSSAVARCRNAMNAGRFDDALSAAGEALELDGSYADAVSCRDAVQTRQNEEAKFREGLTALQRNDVDNAYMAFGELPQQSTYRNRQEVADAARRYAQRHLNLGNIALNHNPSEAVREADVVLSVADLPEGLRRDARDLKRRALRAVSERSREDETSAQVSLMSRAQNCLREGDNRCVIRTLEGNARSPQEFALLIATYRNVGDSVRARHHMQTFVRRFPDSPRAQEYQRILSGQ